MEQGIFYIVMGAVCIICFMLGKYVFPQAAQAINTAIGLLQSYPLLMKWGEAACQYIRQYLSDLSNEEKNKKAAGMIMELAKQAGIEITEEQARSIAQAAYEAIKKGEAESAPKEQVMS